MWKTVAREPLLHFVLLGALLFALDGMRDKPAVAPTSSAPVAIDRTIVLDADIRPAMTERAKQRLGRMPTPVEVDAEIDRWVDEEILFREALARGLERDDPMIHERIASRMSYVLAESAVVPEPTDAQLRAWFDTHRDRYAVPERIDFTHVFVASGDTKRADELAAQLAAGTSAETLGDVFSGGRKYRGRKLADLAEAFGGPFVDGLAAQPPNTWVRRTSRHGIHLVRVDRVEAARAADFEPARLEVRREWIEEQRRLASEAALRQLRERWKVERR
jgi:hypothetical protein